MINLNKMLLVAGMLGKGRTFLNKTNDGVEYASTDTFEDLLKHRI